MPNRFMPRLAQQVAAFALSVVTTLAIFDGTLSLSSPEHAGNWYAQHHVDQPTERAPSRA